jgi:hypothetical protein
MAKLLIDDSPFPDCFPHDYHGECDRCHHERDLWKDESEPGEFAYCRKCWKILIDRLGPGAFSTERLGPGGGWSGNR